MRKALLQRVAGVSLMLGWSGAQAGDWEVHTNVMTVRRLLADSSSVWAVTSGGLYRHDDLGSGFEIINSGLGLGGHDLWAAARAGDSFWLSGTPAVLSLWVAGTRETVRYPLGLGLGRVEALYSVGDTLWVGSDIGVGLFLKQVGGGRLKEVYSRLGTLPAEAGVHDLEVFSGRLWVSTEFGIVSANPGDPALHIASNWTTYSDPTGALATSRRFEVFQDSLYAATLSGLFVWTGGDFEARITQFAVHDLFAEADTLWLACDSGAYYYRSGTVQQVSSANLTPADLWSVARVPGGNLWVAFPRSNLYEYGSFLPWFVEIVVNQPRGSTFASLDFANAVLFCSQREEASSFLRTDGLWGALPGATPSAGAPTLAVRAQEPHVYVTGSGAGLFVLNDITDQITATQYNSANSSLVGVSENAQYTVVPDLAPDALGGFWVANRFTTNGQVLVYFGPNAAPQVVYGSASGLTNNDLNTLLLSGDKLWIGYNGGGLGALEFKGTPEFPGDDTYTVFTSQAQGLPADVISVLLEDREGRIWVGTPAGLARLDPEFFPFLAVEYADVQPADPDIQALAQDLTGALWVGTGKGLARIPNGELVADSVWFSGSSALPSDQVLSLKVDDWAPRLWMGTANGLAERPLTTVVVTKSPQVFPNPFEIRYSGDRATFEVPAGSIVDIFTVTGDRVHTLSTSYQWDGKNETGEPVAAGLYLFRVKYSDGSTGTGRLGVVR